ncbi:MAG TPA: hypothetical protein PKW90_10205 [Myxococcota bacterium]|nr:hypothetical protein [Myxococcota bacterium]
MLFREAGWGAYVQLGLFMVALVWTLVCTVLLGMRWKVPAFIATIPLGLHALGAIAALSASQSIILTATKNVDGATRAMLVAQGMSEGLGNGVLLGLAIPSAMLLGLGGAIGGARGSRSYGPPVIAFLVCGLIAVFPVAELLYEGSILSIGTRLLLYGVGAIIVTVSLLGNDGKVGARESSLSAALSFFVVVSAAEIVASSMECRELFAVLAGVSREGRAEFMGGLMEPVHGRTTLRWVSMFLAIIPVIVAWLRPSTERTEEQLLNEPDPETPMRGAGHFLALGLIPLWLAAAWSADVSEQVEKALATSAHSGGTE